LSSRSGGSEGAEAQDKDLYKPIESYIQGVTNMPDRGSKDKGNKEQRKKAKHTLKEKRKLKKQKEQINTITVIQ